ncbi:MAG TPA: UDP-3-O-(3-hydroxymyristoyl)glucosamine N-acyltransferase [Tepidisphaeraceae bacterium]|nr:UDP-3-O-(3-hydroxymyristoyl)glucosamine N-acyltransferase [Tepidisphaeraceae bacterium]
MPSLADIAAALGISAPSGEAVPITGMATLAEAGPSELSFVGSDAYVSELATTRAPAVIVQKRVKVPATWTRPALVVDDADLAIATVLKLFAPPVPRPPAGIDSAARVAGSAALGEQAAIGPFVFVGERVRIGARTILHSGVYIGDDTVVGDDCELFPHVVLRERVSVGSRVVIHAGSVIGSDGFGYRWDGRRHAKIPHVGTVVIEDDVEIGSCVCIDRAKFSATRVGRGTKIDNLAQIGHNVTIGPHCIIVGQAGLAGSARLGAGVVLGGQAAVRDHITLGDGAMAAACSGVAEDVPPKAIVSGTPALPHRQSLREQAALRRLPDLVTQVRKLQEEIEALKKK